MKIPLPRISIIQRFLASMAAALLVSASAHGTEDLAGQPPVPLISGSKALPVIIPENAPPHTKAAAHFLADTIKTIGGVRPEVIEKLPNPVPAGAVWVGYQPAMDALFPGVDFNYKHPEEIVLAAMGGHVAITGRDKWDPKFSTVPGRRTPITDKQIEYGTANAVFTFLQDRVGVRWLYPGKNGTDYPAPESLAIQPFTFKYHPQFRARIGLFNQLDRGYAKAEAPQEWAKHQRLLLNSLSFYGGHYFKDWWDKYGATRPELFALQLDGTRGTHPEDPKRKKLCEGEPLVWETWLKEMEENFVTNPHEDILYTMPNDSYFDGHCTDPRSRAWDPDPSQVKELIKVNWANGVSEEWPPLSDRYVHFANKLSDLAVEKFPDREFFVMTNAYGEVGKPAPVNAKPRDNILIVSVHNFMMRHKAMREAEKKQLADWAAITKQILWRPNIGNQGGIQTGFPDVPFQQAIEDIRFVAEKGVIGIFFDSLFEHWGTNAPYFYLLSQLAWNPYADGNVILEDYYQRCYGPAAAPMKGYWQLMEATRNNMVETIAMPRAAIMRCPQFFTEEVVAKAEALLAQAAQAAESNLKYAQRVTFTKSGWMHTKTMVEIRALMAQTEENPKKRDEIYPQVLEKWTNWQNMSREFPSYAINTSRLGNTRRIMGFHPDAPITKRALREMNSKPDGLDMD